MKVNEPDPKLRVLGLFADYKKFLRQKKYEELVSANPTVAVGHICSLLRPHALRTKIVNDLALHQAPLRKDWKQFFAYVVAKAVACDEFVPVHDTAHESFTTPPTPRGNKRFYDKDRTKDKNSTTTPTLSGTAARAVYPSVKQFYRTSHHDKPTTSGTSTTAMKNSREPPLCLNDRTCAGVRHFLRDCTKTAETKKRELLDAYHKTKSDGALRRFKNYYAEETAAGNTTTESRGRIRAKLMDKVPVWVSGDYGADHAAISVSHVTQLAEVNCFVPLLPLLNPVSMELAASGDHLTFTITANQKARITTTLLTPEGPFTLRNVEFLVFPDEIPEVLLSRPLLQSLGFNLDAHLARVRDVYHNKDFSTVGFEMDPDLANSSPVPEGRLSGLLSAPISSDGPAAYLDALPSTAKSSKPSSAPSLGDNSVDWGTHTTADVAPHLQRMVAEALEQGLPWE